MKLIREFGYPYETEILHRKLNLLSRIEGIDINLSFCDNDKIEGRIFLSKIILGLENEIEKVSEEILKRSIGFPKHIVQLTIKDIHSAFEAEKILLENSFFLKFSSKDKKIIFYTKEIDAVHESEEVKFLCLKAY